MSETQSTNSTILAQPDEAFLQELRDAAAEMDSINDQRAELNASKKAIVERLQAQYGCNRHAMKAAIQYSKLPDDKRENFDLTYQVTRRALGAPMQADLFDAQLQKTTERAVAASKSRNGGGGRSKRGGDEQTAGSLN
jgi:uncharacterized protein (UPF0335 family)